MHSTRYGRHRQTCIARRVDRGGQVFSFTHRSFVYHVAVSSFMGCVGCVLCGWCSAVRGGPSAAGLLYICVVVRLHVLFHDVGGAAGCRFNLVHVPSPFRLKVQVGLLRSRRPFLLRRALLLCGCVCSVWFCGLALPRGRCATTGACVCYDVVAAVGSVWGIVVCVVAECFASCCAGTFG